MTPPYCLTCSEWEEVPIAVNGLAELEDRRLLALAKRASQRLKLPETAVLSPTRNGLKAGQVVGVLVIPGRTLEILPKIDGTEGDVRKALVRMLAVAWRLRLVAGEYASLKTQHHDLLEILIRLFAERLLVAVRRGLPRRYFTRREDLRLLRGSLDVVRQLTHLAVRPDLLACRFSELSEDTPLNRVLKAAVLRLASLTRSSENTRRLAELTARLESVGDTSDPLREPVRLDRTNLVFHDLHRLARLFLAGGWQSTTSGRTAGFSLLFPMNELFEMFIGQCLKRALGPRPVRLQDRSRHALLTESDGLLFALRPDVVIGRSDQRMVLDTKWKRLRPSKQKSGVERSDIYQMIAYAQAYNAKRLVLLYPWHREMGKEGILNHWRVSGTSCPLDVATINVGRRPDEVARTLNSMAQRHRW